MPIQSFDASEITFCIHIHILKKICLILTFLIGQVCEYLLKK